MVADGWLESRSDRRASTRYLYENHVHVHILPRLGDLRIDRITPRIIEEELRNDLVRPRRLAPQTVNKILGTLTAIFDYAHRHGITEANPARVAERLRVGTAELSLGSDGAAPSERAVDPDDVPSPDEVKRLLVAAEPGVFRTYLTTAALTGARSGELLALTWDDVDLEGGAIHIRRTVTWARTRQDREVGFRGPRFFPPKTKRSRRTVEAPPELVAALRRWKLACPPSDLRLVFPKPDGSAMHRKILQDQGLRPAQTRTELRGFGVHALRHFFASELIRRGYPPTEVASRLGHSSPMVTMTVYAHWYRTATSDAVTGLARTLCEA
jgi:integrase